MRSNADTEWTSKLQPAVLSANTQKKRSTGYTPFYLMFGRDYDSSNLLNLITSSSNNDDRSEPNEDGCTSDPGSPQLDTISMTIDEADPYELLNNDDEWMQEIDELVILTECLLSTTSKKNRRFKNGILTVN